MNDKTIYCCHCAIDENEYNIACHFKLTKDMWGVTHKGINQVKEFKINLIVDNYELFKMKDNDTIIKIFTNIEIVNKPWEGLH